MITTIIVLLFCIFLYKTVQSHYEKKIIKDIANQLSFPVWIRNAKGHLKWCNSFYAEALDLPVKTVMAKNMGLSSCFEKSLSFLQQFPDKPFQQEEFCIISGQRRFLEFKEYKSKKFILGMAFDRTDFLNVQNELKIHVQAQEGVMENLATAVAFFGVDTKLKYFNRSYCMMHQADEQWLKTSPTFSQVMDDLRGRRQIEEVVDFQQYKKIQLDKFRELFEPEEELIHRPDERTWRKITAPHPLGGLMYLYEDVSDRLTLERQYNTLLAVKTETLNNLHEGIVVFGDDHRLKIFNPAFLKMWDFNENAIITAPHLNNILDHIKTKLSDKLQWNEFREGLLTYTSKRSPIRGCLICKDKKMIDFNYIPLPDGAHMLGFIDKTDQHKVELALRDRAEALMAADILKSEFITHISYELRTPLNTIIGFTEILTENYCGPLNDNQQEYLQGIFHSSQQLLILINNVLDLALIESDHFQLEYQEINVYDLLQSVIGLVCKRTKEAGISIELDCPKDIEKVALDSRCITQALFQLLHNAVKFTKYGGTVFFKACIEQNTLKISVEDQGQGILAENQQKVFRKFEKANTFEKYAGVGIGLTLVKNLIEKHGGTVHLTSIPTVGTTVTCSLPLTQCPGIVNLRPQIALPF